MSPSQGTHFWLCLSALVAGVMNSIAGGGTLLTFPTLLSVVSPVLANATSTVALVPGSMAGAWGYRHELRPCTRWALLLAGPSLVGGAIGALLVARMDEAYFKMLVPWLILTAALLFLLQPTLGRMTRKGTSLEASPDGRHADVVFYRLAGPLAFCQFLVALYGGYFGAGIGILMLSTLGLMGMSDIHQMNALKTFLAWCINGVAVAVFILEDKVVWPYALEMASAAIVGGYLGARVARRLNRNLVRWMVIVIGFALAAYYFYQQWGGTPLKAISIGAGLR